MHPCIVILNNFVDKLVVNYIIPLAKRNKIMCAIIFLVAEFHIICEKRRKLKQRKKDRQERGS